MAALLEAIFGPAINDNELERRISTLSKYIEYSEQETKFAFRRCGSPPIDATPWDTLATAIRRLKLNPNGSRIDLKSAIKIDDNEDLDATTDKALVLAVRLMCATACLWPSLDRGIRIDENVFRPMWKESESLTAFIDRVYPNTSIPAHYTASVDIHKLSAGFLTTFVAVDIRWTNQLSDHLLMLKGANWKSLYIYQHPAYLRYSLDILAEADPDLGQSTSQALELGCLPPSLLRETLLTYNILFPEAADDLSRAILEKQVRDNKLDTYFLEQSTPHAQYHNIFRDALNPTDAGGLYSKYPHWGERLYEIWKEADDPTPTTSIGRWSEARRNPRFTFWCTAMAVVLAVLFGLLTILLAAIQIWVSYCSWDINSDQAGCKLRESPASPVPAVVGMIGTGRALV